MSKQSRSERVLPIAIALFAPAITQLNNSLLLDEVGYNAPIFGYAKGVLLLLLLWYFNRWLLLKTEKAKNIKNKYGIIVAANAVIVVSVGLIADSSMTQTIAGPYSFLVLMIRLSLISLVFNIVLRVFHGQRKNAELQLQNLSLKAENLKFQVDMLKQQINPHFLFNSLNTLLDMVENQSEDAVEYIENFSGLYRNVLQSAQYDFINLGQELEFLDAYCSLLRVRFKEAIDLEIEIGETQKDLLIPPLSLQFLVENAVKHNQLSVDEPLKISIRVTEKTLIVSNKIKLKEFSVPGEKVGLINLQKRFSILHQPISWENENGYFKVQLPLKPNTDA